MLRPGDLGFAILPRAGLRSLSIAAAAGLAFGAWMALADATFFAGVVPEVQHRMVAEMATAERLLFHARGALIDEVILRLIGVTALSWTFARVTGRRNAWPAILLVALVIYPALNHAYFAALPPGTLSAARALLLPGVAGVLWGWLYWRHGWSCALAGHWAAHLSLQPLLGVM